MHKSPAVLYNVEVFGMFCPEHFAKIVEEEEYSF